MKNENKGVEDYKTNYLNNNGDDNLFPLLVLPNNEVNERNKNKNLDKSR